MITAPKANPRRRPENPSEYQKRHLLFPPSLSALPPSAGTLSTVATAGVLLDPNDPDLGITTSDSTASPALFSSPLSLPLPVGEFTPDSSPNLVHLRVRAPPRFGDTEVRIDEADDTKDDPEPGRLAAPVERRGIELVGRDDAVEDAKGVVAHACNVDGFGFRARGGELRDEGVGDGTDGTAVDEGVDEEEGARDPAGYFGVETDGGDDATDGEDEAEEAEAPELDGAAAEAAEEAPGYCCSDEAEGVLRTLACMCVLGGLRAYLDNNKVPSLLRRHACSLEEVGGPLHERRATCILDNPSERGDLCTSAVDATEAIKVPRARAIRLTELISIRKLDHGKLAIDRVSLRCFALGNEFGKDLARLISAALADEPPGRLLCPQRENEDRQREDPLQAQRNLNRQHRLIINQRPLRNSTKTLSNNPTHITPSRNIRPNGRRTNIRRIIRHKPRQRHQRRHKRPLIPKPLHEPATQKHPRHLPNRRPNHNRRLPRRRNLAHVPIQRDVGALKASAEDGVGQEPGDENEIEALHDTRAGEDDGLQHGGPEGAHARPGAHSLLNGGCGAGEGDALFALGGVLGAQGLGSDGRAVGAEDAGYWSWGVGGGFFFIVVVVVVVGAAREARVVGESAHGGGKGESWFEGSQGRWIGWLWWWDWVVGV
ncbi:hypothetical protein V494_03826 [Pseudogymnoascus sp. VKM F-4513 (FW-928)]|nr:hypothetical protein V494_03826 [Pseudogymnoascus sp. VKM F-4513 (FW-928)]